MDRPQILTYDTTDFSSDRILRQRLVIEEYGAQINFVSGVNNEAVDALLCLDIQANELQNMHECFLKKRVFETDVIFPLDFTTIAKHQKKDNELKKLLKHKLKKNEFRQVNFHLVALWTVINTKNGN